MSEIERLATAAGLSARQREILASLLAEEGIELDGEPTITPLHGQGDLQLSFAQQRLWFLQRLEPESPFYNIAVAVRLAGALDIAVLGRSLAEVVRRHETLRTTFVERGGEPRVRVAAPGPLRLPLVDLSGLPAAEVPRRAADLALAEARRGFDLVAGPLLRVLLLRLGRREHKIVLTLHHIIADGWSLGVLVREVGALYGAFVRGGGSPLPELPFQVADYAAWQRSWLRGAVLEKELAHWRAKLEGVDPVLELPFDHPRPARRCDRGATRVLVLPAELVQAAERLSRREGTSLFMILLAAFLALLQRYTGRRDLVIGYPVANRTRSDIERLIGFFVNSLVLRVDLSRDPSARALLGRVRDEVLEAQSHAQLPFERLVEELRPERSLAYNPLFQVMFVLQNAPAPELEIPGLAAEASIVDLGTAQLDLSFSFERAGEAMLGRLEHSTDLFAETTIERLLGHYRNLLAGFVATPWARIADLPFLTAPERHQLLLEWNDTRAWRPEDALILDLIAAQTDRVPDATAVVEDERSLTYRELDRRAGELARTLCRLGVGPEALVGVCAAPTLELAAALLAVLKAGGAYLPLDPAVPEERLAWILADSAVSHLLLGPEQPGSGAFSGARILRLDGVAGAAPAPGIFPESAAYVLYTSGSTGRPKGVQTCHRALANHSRAVVERFALGPGDRSLQLSSLGFDVAVEEIFPFWTVGATVVLRGPGGPMAVGELLALAERQQATCLNLPSSSWREWMIELERAAGGPRLASLRLLVVGSEPAQREWLAPWSRLSGDRVRLLNAYGVTEATVAATLHDPAAPVRGRSTALPVGRPLPNISAFVLGPAGDPAPIGVAGELCLGGAGVARGYFRRAGLTAERFVPDPFAPETGARLYRTGDVARLLASGEIELLGRNDQQVKVRGFRIEPEEIEEALRQHEAVRDAVVVLAEAAGEKRLVACVIASDGAAAGELRRFLKTRLPEHMIPAGFVLVDSLPRTAGGKLDRRGAAALAPSSFQRGDDGAARTPVEEILAGIWAEVLGLERVGAEEDFFELGGHSLLASRVASRLRSAFQVELPLRDLFEAPTVAGLAVRVEAALRTGVGLSAPPLVPAAREGRLPLSFAQQRLWFLDQLEPESPLYNVPAALRVDGPLQADVLARSLAEIVRRHESLRTVFAVDGGEPVQVIQPAVLFALPVVDLGGLPESAREALAPALAGEEAGRPFDLARGPLLRGLLLRMTPADHVVLVTTHHIASDGWSTGILVREVTALYEAFAAGRPSPLPELSVQYADFAVWQRGWLRGEVLEREIAYWRRQLSGLPPVLALPTDRPRPAVRSFRGARREVRLPAGLAIQVQALGRREGATAFMVLLAALQALLGRTAGQEDLAVGTPIAGRNRLETEELIGFFVNTLVLRGDLSGAPSFRTLLGRVREASLAAYLHQDLPFEKLVEELEPERSLAHAPLFQVMFVLQNAPEEDLEVEGLRLRPYGTAGTTAKFDLTLSLAEVEGRLAGGIELSTDLFDGATVERLIGHFERLLAGALAAPELAVAALPWLSAAERSQVVAEWNDTAVAGTPELPLHELFETWAAKRAEAVAVVCGGEGLTFRALNQRANRLARLLRRSGVGRESRVVLVMERSVDLIAGLLAVLKASGCFVILDPGQPAVRLAQTVRDAAPVAILTRGRIAAALPPCGAPVIPLDRVEQALAGESGTDLGLPVAPGQLAYGIYTSGSTGTPKGILIRHDAVANLLVALEREIYAGAGPELGVAVNAPLFFDGAIKQVIQVLRGRRLEILPEEVRADAEALLAYVAARQIDVLDCAPSQLRALLDAGLGAGGGWAPGRMLVGGEALEPAVWDRLRALPGTACFNVYGPSECTVDATVRRIGPDAPRPVIGRAISNVQVYVLDDRASPLPVGVAGELRVGGAGLARGYLNRPELTAERFVPDPFSNRWGARLYRTGDLARWTAAGELEYVGRLDHQVKVRGFRIELGEIEAALGGLAGVREAVVAAQGAPGDRHLVAYVAGEVAAGALRDQMRERLPEYMVPARWVALEALPRNPNGKVDRQALPAPAAAGIDPGAAGAAPRTFVEELLCEIWADVLDVPKVEIHDDFFALGGHSLLVPRTMSRLREACGVEVPLRALFDAPTVARLAVVVAQARSRRRAPEPPLVRLPRRGQPQPLAPAQLRFWARRHDGGGAVNCPLGAHLTGALDVAALERSFDLILRRHEALRTCFVDADGEPAQLVCEDARLNLGMVDLADLAAERREAEARRLGVLVASYPLDLAQAPLFQALLVRLGRDEHVLLMVKHHLVTDGWSEGIFCRELGILYCACREGVPPPLPELTVQYRDFAAWQRELLGGGAFDELLGYWMERLRDLPVLAIPTDRPRPAIRSIQGGERRRRLDPELSRAVRALGRREGASPFMTLLAAWKALLFLWSGQDDIALTTNIANRRAEIEHLIGLFTNTIALRTDLSGDPSFRELLGRIRETTLEAFAHQDMPFLELLSRLRKGRAIGYNDIFPVGFVLQNTPAVSIDLPGLTARAVDLAAEGVPRDLILVVTDGEEGIAAILLYRSDIFAAATVDRLLACFETLLDRVAGDPDLRLSTLAGLVRDAGLRSPQP